MMGCKIACMDSGDIEIALSICACCLYLQVYVRFISQTSQTVLLVIYVQGHYRRLSESIHSVSAATLPHHRQIPIGFFFPHPLQIGELTPHWYNTNDCLYIRASLWLFKSFSSILVFVDPSLQMAYQNTPAPQLKEDKELRRDTQCQAQKYMPRSDNTDQSFY